MTTWFLDASVLLACEDVDDRNHESSVRLLVGSEPIATLDLAYFEVMNVAIRAWHNQASARRLLKRVEAISADRGLVRVDAVLIDGAAAIATEQGISVYDAAYVSGAARLGAELVSCDERDLVSRGLARRPSDA